jgi:hypothetical protein
MSTTNTTTVNVTNVTVMQAAYTEAGLGQIPAGTTPDAAVQGLETALFAAMQKGWPAGYGTYPTGNQTSGIAQPWSSNVAGTAPKCVVQAITQAFTGWGLPVDAATITLMAQTITQGIANNAGNFGTFPGLHRIGGVTIYWSVGFVAAPVEDGPPSVNGIIYTFCATESF